MDIAIVETNIEILQKLKLCDPLLENEISVLERCLHPQH